MIIETRYYKDRTPFAYYNLQVKHTFSFHLGLAEWWLMEIQHQGQRAPHFYPLLKRLASDTLQVRHFKPEAPRTMTVGPCEYVNEI